MHGVDTHYFSICGKIPFLDLNQRFWYSVPMFAVNMHTNLCFTAHHQRKLLITEHQSIDVNAVFFY